MATVRLIDNKNKVYEMDSSEHTFLIYLSAGEKKLVSSLQDGEVFIVGPKHLSNELYNKQKDKLVKESKPHYIEQEY
jgi:predicted transcriptional regulator